MTPTLTLSSLALLAGVAFVAGAIDAIAGGGGLLTVPALLSAGLPPHLALGTNKGQSVFGSAAALFRYQKAGLVNARQAAWTFPAGFSGALAGVVLVLWVQPAVLRPLVLVLLVAAGIVVAFRRAPSSQRPPPARARTWAVLIALGLGVYDGFFGPGTGTFLFLAFAGVLHASAPQATADAKVVNFASNLAAVALFALRGSVLWAVALPMAAAQALGGYAGAQLAVRGGERIIRLAVLGVVMALVARLGMDLWGNR